MASNEPAKERAEANGTVRRPAPSGADGLRARARRRCLLAAVCIAGLAGPASADVARDAAVRGNEFFGKAQYKEADAAYQLARDGGYATPQVVYNQACAKLEIGQLDDAERLFRQVDADPASGSLAAAARFNLGSAAYRQARALMEKSQQPAAGNDAAPVPPAPAEILDLLKKSDRGFRGALELDPTDQDAARNVETVQRAIRQIKDQIEAQRKQQEQQQQQQQKDGQPSDPKDQKPGQKSKDDQKQQEGKQDDQQGSPDSKQEQKQDQKDDAADAPKSAKEQLSDLARKQQELAEQSRKTAQERKDSQQGKPGSPSEQELRDQEARQREQQRELNRQTQEASKQLGEEKKAAPSPEDKQKLDESSKQTEAAERAQQRAEQALKNHNPEKASQEQQRASELLQQAAGNAAEAEQPPQPSPAQPQEGQQEAKEPSDAQQPKSDMTAARILDKERREAAQKALRSLRLRGRAAPVEKDW